MKRELKLQPNISDCELYTYGDDFTILRWFGQSQVQVNQWVPSRNSEVPPDWVGQFAYPSLEEAVKTINERNP